MELKDLVEYMAKTLVEDPSQVQVNVIEGSSSITLELRVAPDDMGRVIGKSGRIANASGRLCGSPRCGRASARRWKLFDRV